MPRPRKSRNINNPPRMKGFRPFGMQECVEEAIRLRYEEYESIRLVNYDKLSHENAAKRMNVSRPTFTRIYNRALGLIAESFVEGKALEIEGGNYVLDKDWFRCKKCFKLIQGKENHTKCKNCSSFSNNELVRLNV
ncbi:MAG: DUF134 domain-containing protein [Bacteroidales bacterium]